MPPSRKVPWYTRWTVYALVAVQGPWLCLWFHDEFKWRDYFRFLRGDW